ncbi:PD-(D/E)XK nuclease family protein [Haloferula sp. BvORR071]|uniref:PD-(D/E)XK nuclease family protein n=1 Tax=Haloferula sp. BvORR071 TaxID=1396141 RepID=UPI002240E8DD|nr:PD-(D/E)XK nuclease family protein [Haloferula sp. BvORR071]
MSAWLLERCDDLAGMLVVVPTAQAGRLLREALAEAAGALIAPRVVTPEHFFRPASQDGIASRLESRFAWIEVLRGMDAGSTPALFPVEPVDRSFAWAAGVAEEIDKVRNTLSESSKDFAEARGFSPEKDRWGDMIEIERRVQARFSRWKLTDPLAAKLEAAAGFELPPGVREIVVAGVPDPVPLAVEVWARLGGAGVPVKVLVHAPVGESEGFDEWGRPQDGEHSAWTKRPTPLLKERVHLVAGPTELAAQALRCFSGKASKEVTLGLCDPVFGPALESAFTEAGWPAFNPEGRTAGSAMILMLRSFAALAQRRDIWEPVATILRSPLLPEIVGRKQFHAALKVLDEIEKAYLPASLARVTEICAARLAEKPEEGAEKLLKVLGWCESWRERFASGRPSDALAGWLAAMRARRIDDAAEGQLLEALAEAVPHVERLEDKGLLEGPGEALELVLASLETLRSASGREDSVIDLSGWLELSHAPGARLVLAGMHEGCVPDGNLDDSFLPQVVREGLKLRDPNSRHVRDAYLFHALVASHETDVIVAKVDAVGEPRRPSRLLLSAKGLELAERVIQLSASPPSSAGRLLPWERGEWLLDLKDELKPYLNGERKLSPSAIRDYLYCPFRFYLKRVLKWQPHDAGKLEMDELDFGNLCHDALERMGKEPAIVETLDFKVLRQFLWDTMDERLARYGSNLSLPLMVQREAARTRMERFAELEIGQRHEGWRTKNVELNIGKDIEWEIDGQSISMQIDRIDFHPELGWRVLDYKTSARADVPRSAHLRRSSEKRREFGAGLPASRGAPEVWKNVQVPLYAAFVQGWKGLDQVPKIGYVNLPATLNDVGFEMWEDFDAFKLDNAMQWSTEIIRAMRAGLHWPPVALTGGEAGYDDFALLAPDGLEQAVSGPLVEALRHVADDWDAGRRAP